MVYKKMGGGGPRVKRCHIYIDIYIYIYIWMGSIPPTYDAVLSATRRPASATVSKTTAIPLPFHCHFQCFPLKFCCHVTTMSRPWHTLPQPTYDRPTTDHCHGMVGWTSSYVYCILKYMCIVYFLSWPGCVERGGQGCM